MSTTSQIKKLYIVKKRIDFWKEDESVRKYFVDKKKAEAYLEFLSNEDIKVPTVVFIEEDVCIQDTNQNIHQVYMLKGNITPLEKEIFIEFAYNA
jgi:hypothetical protein